MARRLLYFLALLDVTTGAGRRHLDPANSALETEPPTWDVTLEEVVKAVAAGSSSISRRGTHPRLLWFGVNASN